MGLRLHLLLGSGPHLRAAERARGGRSLTLHMQRAPGRRHHERTGRDHSAGTSSPMWRDRCSISNRIPSATRCGTFASSRTRRGCSQLLDSFEGRRQSDRRRRRPTKHHAITHWRAVFVFGGRGGARGPLAFEANRLQVTGAVTDEDAVGASSAIRTRSRFATIR